MKEFAWAMIVLPVVPIGMAWVQLLRAPAEVGGKKPLRIVLLILVSASQALLLAGAVIPSVLGPSYSAQRSATILANIVAMAIAAVLSVRAGGRERLPLVASCALVLSCWIYMLAVSSLV